MSKQRADKPNRSSLPHPRPQTTVEAYKAVFTSGPLPSPDVLRGYDELVPGAGDRIISMAEREAAHRHEMDLLTLQADESFIHRGQWFGFVLGLTGLITSPIALYLGSSKVAGLIGGMTVLGLVSIFVLGRLTSDKTS